MNAPTISLVMLTLDAEEFLDLALGSAAPYCDEVIVIDQGSKDRTVEIAKSYGARVTIVEGNFSVRGEKYFRDLAVELCTGDWMMVIDSDEVLSDGWAGPIRKLLAERGDEFGCIEIPFYHLMASYEFQSLDSPFSHAVFVKRHPKLRGCAPMVGPFAHSFYHETYEPKVIHQTDVAAIFHLGYVQKNLMKRWETNMRRGDYDLSAAEQEATLENFRSNPCLGFSEVKRLTIPLEKYPASLRERVGRSYTVHYDEKTRRIQRRIPYHQMKIAGLMTTGEVYYADRARACYETWLPEFDGFQIHSFAPCDFLPITQVGIREGYRSCWDKRHDGFRAALAAFPDFEWFCFFGCDNYVWVDRLRALLADVNTRHGQPTLVGARPKFNFKLFNGTTGTYPSGGAGYCLNRSALKMIVAELEPLRARWRSASNNDNTEDIFMGWAVERLRIQFLAYPQFHPGNPGPTAPGFNTAVTYHYVMPDEVRRLHDSYSTETDCKTS